MICEDPSFLHTADASDEMFICFTIPSEATYLVEDLSDAGSQSYPSSRFLPFKPLLEYSTLLEIINELIKLEESSVIQAPNTDLINPDSPSCLSWISMRFPLGETTRLEHCNSSILHIEANSFFCSSSRVEVNNMNRTVEKNEVKFVSFKEVLDARKARCTKAMKKDSETCRSNLFSVPILVVILQPSEFEYQSCDRSSFLLPQIIEKSRQDDGKSEAKDKLIEEGKGFHFRVRGLPEEVVRLDNLEANEKNKEYLPSILPCDTIWKANERKQCMMADSHGKIYFVSAAFILHSFFFRRLCVVYDFLCSPATGACSLKRDVLSVIIESENNQYFSGNERKGNENEPHPESYGSKNEEESVATRKRRCEASEERFCASSETTTNCHGSSLSSCCLSLDREYIKEKICGLRSAFLSGEPIEQLLKCCFYSSASGPSFTQDFSLLTEKEVTKTRAWASEWSGEEKVSHGCKETTKLPQTSLIPWENVCCALEPTSLLGSQLMGSSCAEDFFSSSSVGNLLSCSSISPSYSTELVDFFDWNRVDENPMKRDDSCVPFGRFAFSHGHKTNATHTPAADILLQRGKKWASCFLRMHSFSKQNSTLQPEEGYGFLSPSGRLCNNESMNYRLLLVLEVIRCRQEELSYILQLLKSSPTSFSSSSPGHREAAYATLSSFWDEVASEVQAMEAHPLISLTSASQLGSRSPFTPSASTGRSMNGGDSQIRVPTSTERLTGEEAMLLYVQHFSNLFSLKTKEMGLLESRNLSQWKSYLAFLLLYSSGCVDSWKEDPVDSGSSASFPILTAKNQHNCAPCVTSCLVASFPVDVAQIPFPELLPSQLASSPELLSALKHYRAVKAYSMYISECITAVKNVYLNRWLKHDPVG